MRSVGDLRDRWLVIGMTVFAALLRLPLLDRSLQGDEFFTAAMMELPIQNILRRYPHFMVDSTTWIEITPPLYYVLTWPMTALLGNTEVVLRSISALAGVAAIPAIYLLGAEVWDRQTGLAAGLLLALSPPHILYSQTARSYALFLLFTTLSMLFLVRGCRTGRPLDRAGFILTTLAALFTNYLAGFLLPAGALIVMRRSWSGDTELRNWLFAGIGISLLYAAYLPMLLSSTPLTGPQDGQLTTSIVAGSIQFLGGNSPYLLTTGLLLVGGIWAGLQHDRGRTAEIVLFLVAAVIGTLWLGWQFTLTGRYSFAILIPALLLAGRGLSALERPGAASLTVLLLTGTMSGMIGWTVDEPWSTAITYVEEHSDDKTLIIIHTSEYQRAFTRYENMQVRPLGGGGRVLGTDHFRWLQRVGHPAWLVLQPRHGSIPDSIALLGSKFHVSGIRLGTIRILRLRHGTDESQPLRCPPLPTRWIQDIDCQRITISPQQGLTPVTR